MSRLKNFVLETASTPGTGDFILNGPPQGRLAFVTAFPAGGDVFYFADDGTQAEWGIGSLTVGPPSVLVRKTVIGNTFGNSGILRFSGQVEVYNEIPAEYMAILDDDGGLTLDKATFGALAVDKSLAVTGTATVPDATDWSSQQALNARAAEGRYVGKTVAVVSSPDDNDYRVTALGVQKGQNGGPDVPYAAYGDGSQFFHFASDDALIGSLPFTAIYSSAALPAAPSWATRVHVILVGAGGGGGQCKAMVSDITQTNAFGPGGAAGAYAESIFSLSGITSARVEIGSGGSSDADGGDSVLYLNENEVMRAGGGKAGSWIATASSRGGVGGSPSGANVFGVQGAPGTDGQNGWAYFAGNGAAGPYGGGGRAGARGGLNAVTFGAGGGGSYDTAATGTMYPGGTGANGVVLYRFLP
ncbi:MAG: hypothetical protein ABF887_00610 [Gluconobacter oxydans]|mgnify:CR=1 FL=1|uniref:glycine-rich domain-containing protein n=1 Tax=Gluconobacter oxydans TaxID=442 RepID=UPI0039E78064